MRRTLKAIGLGLLVAAAYVVGCYAGYANGYHSGWNDGYNAPSAVMQMDSRPLPAAYEA